MSMIPTSVREAALLYSDNDAECTATQVAQWPRAAVRTVEALLEEAREDERQWAANTKEAEQAGAEAEKLAWGAVHNAGKRGPRRQRWAAVRDALGVGSTTATELCVAHDLDPDESVGRDDADVEPPPNTERVRILVDVSAFPGDGCGRVVYTGAERHAAPAVPRGYRRSVVVADVPVPEPIAEIAGTVEAP